MAAGTPVIAWRSGALPEIVTEGRTGFLVSSVEEMADRMRAVAMIRDESCRAEAQKRFDSELMISKYIGLYQTVAGRSVSPELQAA
jgi:glycosyltransferase involved in cell wall biosynthesis